MGKSVSLVDGNDMGDSISRIDDDAGLETWREEQRRGGEGERRSARSFRFNSPTFLQHHLYRLPTHLLPLFLPLLHGQAGSASIPTSLPTRSPFHSNSP